MITSTSLGWVVVYGVLDSGAIAQSIAVRRFEKSICSCYVGGFVGGMLNRWVI